jgi:hypothetical protein
MKPRTRERTPVLDRVEPIVKKKTFGGHRRLLRGILRHGVVSCPARQRPESVGLSNPEGSVRAIFRGVYACVSFDA